MTALSYRMETVTPDDLAAEDPFGGGGVFLSCPEDTDGILAALDSAFGGTVPAVSWPGRGAWVDLREAGITVQEALAFWDTRMPYAAEEV